MDKYFIYLFNPLLAGDVWDLGSGVFVEEPYGVVVKTFVLNLTGQKTHFLTWQMCSDADVGESQFKQQQAIAFEPNWQHDLYWKEPRAVYRFRVFTGWALQLSAWNIGVQKPFFFSGENRAEAGLGTLQRQKRKDWLNPTLTMRLSKLVRYSL